MPLFPAVTRRRFLAQTAALSAAAATGKPVTAADSPPPATLEICAFEKFLQDLSYDQLAEVIAELGFNGIEATVRKNGHVLPERVEDDLPKLVESLKKHDLEVTVMATNILSADSAINQKVLRTAATLGIKRYRMWYYQYDRQGSVTDQLDEFKPALDDLAALNRDIGIGALYQNHAGESYVGATLWDLERLLREVAIDEVGCAFDIRHAIAATGDSWPVVFRLMQPHMAAVYVKDFRWENGKAENVALGTGQVDPRFFRLLRQSRFSGPISLHVEYLEHAGTQPNIAALENDLHALRAWLAES